MQDTECFKVVNETKDFATIELVLGFQFKGKRVGLLPRSQIAEYYQFLLDEHGLMPILTMQGAMSPGDGESHTVMACRKVQK